jgi:hypothetical protein
LTIADFGPIRSAQLDFGNLTVLVGPQASGKSIALQLLKLVIDAPQIKNELRRYGLDWSSEIGQFFDVYFGEGMRSLWRSDQTEIVWNGTRADPVALAKMRASQRPEALFFVPAQRVLTLRDGWPRPFTDYLPGDPFVVREFSERLRILVENEFNVDGDLFPQSRRLKGALRDLLLAHLFPNFRLQIDKPRAQKRLVLGGPDNQRLPYMVWSAGQREFVPLLLGLYWLMPRAAQRKRPETSWVVLEELEMGLHPRGINTVLLFVFELLRRGYRVCLSTHSPQVLDTLWALKELREHGAPPEAVRAIFGYSADPNLADLERAAMDNRAKVYYFDGPSGSVRDISDLDVEDESWGGLTEFNVRANRAVADAVARSETA